MSKPVNFKLMVATANDLASGAVVFRDAQGRWLHDVQSAFVAQNPEEAQKLLTEGEADVARNTVVDLALIAVTRSPEGLTPVQLRERIRAEGPTIPVPLGRI